MNTLHNISGRTARRLTARLAAKAERFKFPPSHAIRRSPEVLRHPDRKYGIHHCYLNLYYRPDLLPLNTATMRVKSPQKTLLRPSTGRRLEYLMDRGLCEMFGENLVVAVSRYRKRQIDGTVTTEKIDDKSPTCGV